MTKVSVSSFVVRPSSRTVSTCPPSGNPAAIPMHALGRGWDGQVGPIQVMRQRGIGLGAGGQQVTDARHAIRAGQHGPIVAPAHALEDGFEIGLQADHRAARGQRLTVGWIDHSAAARGDHEAGRRGHLTADRGFQRPESRLAILREDLRDGFAGALHDQIVQVNERTSQPCRHFAADSGLAGAHEAGEDDIAMRHVASL